MRRFSTGRFYPRFRKGPVFGVFVQTAQINQEADSMRVSAGPPPNLRGKQRMPRYVEQARPFSRYQLVPSSGSTRNIHAVT